MKLEWLGEYRDFVEKMIKFANMYANSYQKEAYLGSEIHFSPSQLQTMEYILESEGKTRTWPRSRPGWASPPAPFPKM